MNPLLADAAARKAAGLPVIDLSDTNFHRNGLRYPDERLARHFAGYVTERGYDPDPHGRIGTRERIAEWYAAHGVTVDPARTFLTASTSESYALLFQALLHAGDTVLLPRPTYPLFAHLCEYARVKPVYYSLEIERSFSPDFAEVEARLSAGAAACVTITPNNPTGSLLTAADEARFEELCARHGAILIRDEVFRGFEWDDGCAHATGEPQVGRPAHAVTSAAAATRSSRSESGPPRIRLGGVSKLFASPDLKLAWICVEGGDRYRALSADESVSERLELANDTFLNASPVSQFVVERMFADGADVREAIRSELACRRALVDEVLGGLAGREPRAGGASNGPIEVFPQAGGIHRVLRIPGADDESAARGLLRESGVLVHPGYFYDFPDDGYWVISTVPTCEVLHEGLEAIERFVG